MVGFPQIWLSSNLNGNNGKQRNYTEVARKSLVHTFHRSNALQDIKILRISISWPTFGQHRVTETRLTLPPENN